MRLPEKILALMRLQYGLVTRRQLLDASCRAGVVDAAVHRGELEKVHWGVYRVPGGAEPPEQRVLAAVLRCRRGARASGRTACALHNVEGFALGDDLHVTIPLDRWMRKVPWTVVPAAVDVPDRATVRDIPAVTPARALIDVASLVTPKALRVAIDSARSQGLVTPERLERRARALAAEHSGARTVLELLASGLLAMESEGERALARLCEGTTLVLELNQWLLPGVRVDAVDRSARLVLEYQGRRHHSMEAEQDADWRRKQRLEETGWKVVFLTADDVQRRPASTVAMLERLRQERTAELAG